MADAQAAVERDVKLPAGWTIEWGGQFEHLQRSKLRFAIVVPVTLALVFFLLYFSLRSMRDVLLIYSTIPFAVIGGVFALWFRGMPFSVSAAIGFIALFGTAVENGTVLVTFFNQLSKEGLNPMDSERLAGRHVRG